MALVCAAVPLLPHYMLTHDLPVLLFPALWLVAQTKREGKWLPYELPVLLLMLCVPVATRGLNAIPLPLAPLLLLLFFWVVWRRVNGSPSPNRRGDCSAGDPVGIFVGGGAERATLGMLSPLQRVYLARRCGYPEHF